MRITTTRPHDTRGSKPASQALPIFQAADSSQKQSPRKGGDGEGGGAEGGGAKKMAKKGKDLKEEMDNLVDEIDEVLEDNAEAFVKNYVQRGGE